jgi:hypothetical protein
MVRLGGQPQGDTLYGRNNEGEAGQTYVSQVPGGESVAVGSGGKITNSPG